MLQTSQTDTVKDPTRLYELVDRLAEHAADRVVIAAPDGALTGADLAAAVDEAESALVRRGLRSGDRALILCENSAALCVLIFAVSRIGAWPVPVNARIAKPEIERIAEHCEPRLRLYTAGASEPAARLAAADGATLLDLDGIGGVHATAPADAVQEASSGDPAADVAVLLYTSGTTGRPKGVMLTHGNLMFTARQSSALRAIAPGDRVLGVLPVAHVFGLATVFLGTLYGLGELVLRPRFDAAEIAGMLEADGISIFQGVPAMYARFLELAGTRGGPLPAPHLRFLSSGGAPLDLTIKRRIEAMWGVPLRNGYGLTETTAGMCATTAAAPAEDDSVGVAFPGVEVAVADPQTGRPVPQGEIGEFLVRGPSVMKGYYRDPAETAETLTPEGWLRTGDFARQGDNGHYYIVGRLKELIIRSGFNVYPVEVETALHSHPDVALAAVVGRAAADGDEEVVAFVQPVSGRALTEATLDAHLGDRLAPYKRPSRYVFLDELPATPAGKVLKAELKAHAAALADPRPLGRCVTGDA